MAILSVKASGMLTAVGFNSPASVAAIRAGISGISEVNLWDLESGEYLKGARPKTPQWWEGPDMLAELATPPIIECLESLPQETHDSIPVFLLLSAPSRPFRHSGIEKIVVRGIEHRLQYKLPPGSTLINKGRSGIFYALNATKQLIEDHKASHCIIVGVDSYLRQNVVDIYLRKRRILSSDNSNGFIPGEAACAILVGQSGLGPDSELCITGLGLGHETGIIGSDHPVTGNGLTQAIKSALKEAQIMFSDTDYWLTDQNGEHDKAKECTFAQIRLERRYPPARPYQIWHPIEYLGEIGSAIGPCLIGLAHAVSKKGCSPGPLALMHVSNDDGERTALVLQWVDRK